MRRLGKMLLWLPFLLIGLFILYEAVGMAVNHAASAWQTRELARLLERELPQVEILDCYTETGNTSGTGNHVDMLSAVLFRPEAEREEILGACQKYGDMDEWSFWAKPLEKVQAAREGHSYIHPFLEEMSVPSDLEDCWLLYINKSAPFLNNIEGH